MDAFLEEHPTIIPLFEIDAISAVDTPLDEEVIAEALPQDELDSTTIIELRHARDAFERELAISQRVKASTLESLNLDSDENPRTLQIANNSRRTVNPHTLAHRLPGCIRLVLH